MRKYFILVIAFLQLLLGCSHGITPARIDIGPSLHKMGKLSEWQCQATELGKTGFVAEVGIVHYDNPVDGPDYYCIGVHEGGFGSQTVVFQREFPLADLPADFDPKNVSKIVSFDETSGTATFSIGDKRFLYSLK